MLQGCIKFRIPPWGGMTLKNWEAFQKGRKEGKKKRQKKLFQIRHGKAFEIDGRIYTPVLLY